MINIKHIKTLLGIEQSDTSKDNQLVILCEQCKNDAIAYTHNDNIPSSVIEQMVCYRFGTLGNDSLASESYSGVSYSYNHDYPSTIITSLNHYRKMMFR